MLARVSGLARPLVSEFSRVARRFIADEGFLLASALSFALLICLAPLTLILFSIAGFLLESDAIAEYVFDSTSLVFPAYGAELAELISLLTRERSVAGILGGAGLLVFATELFTLTRMVMNRVFRVPVRRRLLHGFSFDLLAVIVGGSLVVGSALVTGTMLALGDVAHRLIPVSLLALLPFRRVVSRIIIYATGVGLLFFAYRMFPNTRVPRRAAALATAVVTVLWEVGRWAFTAYIGLFGVYGKLYGSVGVGVAALVWVYYSATVFLFGAELAAILTERSGAAVETPRDAPASR